MTSTDLDDPAAITLQHAADDSFAVALQLRAPADRAQYAFYLMRDGKRVAFRGYSAESSAAFPGPHAPGRYSATGFVLRQADDSRWSVRSSSVDIDTLHRPTRLQLPVVQHVGTPEALQACIDLNAVQRLDVAIPDGFTYNLLIGPRRGHRLFVILRGAVPDRGTITLPMFSRFSWRDEFPGTVVCIADPTLRLDARLRLAWYFGSREIDATAGACEILRSLCRAMALDEHNVVFYGSSGGGFAALQMAARIGNGATAVAINPQIDVFDYSIQASVNAFVLACLGGMARSDARSRFAVRLSAAGAWRERSARQARCLLVQNRVDSAHYGGHYRHFADAFGIPDNGHSIDQRMASIVYRHPSGHAAEPREMLPRILETALALRT